MKLKGKVKFVSKDKSLFFPTLRKRVDAYFTDNNLSKTGNSRILLKSIILTVVFQLAHTVEGTSHPRPDANGNIENDWAIHQMNTTVNFSRNSRLLSWYVGGLNFQIEHHLFPRVCHVHYPAISGIVKETAAEYGIPYLENETFGQAVRSHIATLHRFGRLPSMNDAIG